MFKFTLDDNFLDEITTQKKKNSPTATVDPNVPKKEHPSSNLK